MSEKKELNIEDLDKVTGGNSQIEFNIREHGAYVSPDDAKNYVGSFFYVVDDEEEEKWSLCQLMKVNSVPRFYVFDVKETPGEKEVKIGGVRFNRGKQVKVLPCDVTLYFE